MIEPVQYPETRVIVFCKAPVPGKVNTRLAGFIGAKEAAVLHEEMARRLLDELLDANLAGIELWCSPTPDYPLFHEYAGRGVEVCTQAGTDLGARMFDAMRECLARPGVSKVILVGTDCPTLDRDYVKSAIGCLSSNEAVLGPAEDGGYGLVGLTRPNQRIFEDINWGSDQVCAETARRLNESVQHWALLPLLWDVDRPADLERYRALNKPVLDQASSA